MKASDEQVKSVLITGAARRVGAAIAEALHAEGYQITVHYHHSAKEAKQLVDSLNQRRSHSAIALCADLNSHADIQRLATQSIDHWQGLQVLINNASSYFPTPITQATPEQWDQLFNSNCKGAFFLTQACQNALAKQQGCVINISDAILHRPQYPLYAMAKAALNQMTTLLASALAPDIRVNAIAPGILLWPEGDASVDAATQQAIVDQLPLKRIGHPNQLIQAIKLMIENTYITGQILAIDGGRSLS